MNLEYVLKDEIQRCYEAISRDTRRKNVLIHYLTRLRLGKPPAVVLAELEAAGEAVTMPAEEEAEP